MAHCPFCDEENTVHEAMDAEKEERLKRDTEHLQGKELVRVICEDCGHAWYMDQEQL